MKDIKTEYVTITEVEKDFSSKYVEQLNSYIYPHPYDEQASLNYSLIRVHPIHGPQFWNHMGCYWDSTDATLENDVIVPYESTWCEPSYGEVD